MSTRLKIQNYPDLNIKEKASLNGDVNSGATSVILTNANNVSNGDYLLLGRPGSESGEIRTVSGVAGNTITIDALTQLHKNGEKVSVLFAKKINIYRASNVDGTQPADTNFTSIGIISIDSDQLDTIYTDTTGSNAYWYKYTYLNDSVIPNLETNLSDSGAARGGGSGQYATLDSIREEAGLKNNRNISDGAVDEKRQAAQAMIDGRLSGRYTVPFSSPVNPFISQIARVLAAGYLLTKEYGSYTPGASNEGAAKIKWATDELQKIVDGSTKLGNEAGADLPQSGDLGFSGIANSTTEDQYGANGFMFKRTSIDGYGTRRY